jgi:hypothetical protein
MTDKERETATKIVKRLLKEDFNCEDHRGRTDKLIELAGIVMDAWMVEDYPRLIEAARRLNAEYKELQKPLVEVPDDDHWEH